MKRNIYRKYNTKPRPIFTSGNETKTNNVLNMKTNQSERERSIGVTSNDNIVTNNQALKIRYPSN